MKLVKTCPENCDASCYRCLRSFKNKFEHILLDRHVGAELLEYLLTGQLPEFDLGAIAEIYFMALERPAAASGETTYQDGVQISLVKGVSLTVPILATRKNGKQFAIRVVRPAYPQPPGRRQPAWIEKGNWH